ncbi:hypothetical protein [Mesorhizobium abyssinicae]|uniref:hypothetical protein n=1 Tax=Mesorhizobium abyssinicae TaxID=1209958 RepID=UPI003CE79CBF
MKSRPGYRSTLIDRPGSVPTGECDFLPCDIPNRLQQRLMKRVRRSAMIALRRYQRIDDALMCKPSAARKIGSSFSLSAALLSLDAI